MSSPQVVATPRFIICAPTCGDGKILQWVRKNVTPRCATPFKQHHLMEETPENHCVKSAGPPDLEFDQSCTSSADENIRFFVRQNMSP